MKQTLMIKLITKPEHHKMLLCTMEHFNAACNYVSKFAFDNQVNSQFRLQHLMYYYIRKHYKLSAQMAVRVIDKVAGLHRISRHRFYNFKPHSTIIYDSRMLSFKGINEISVLTLSGRQIIPIKIGEYQRVRMNYIIKQTNVILRKNIFYLAVVIDTPEPIADNPISTLGVDFGIINLAADSDNELYSGKTVDRVRERTEILKAALQRKDTKSAKHHLKKLSGKESRFRRYTNHVISKRIVTKAKDTHCQIALENLKGIGDSTVHRSQRRRHKSWAFYQLRQFITYKAKIAGVNVCFIDPYNTSRKCPKCGYIAKSNRKTRTIFSCQQCGFTSNADIVGAINIASKAVVNRPIVASILA